MVCLAAINIALLVALGTLGMMILVIFIIILVLLAQKRLLKQQSEMQEIEAAYQRELLQASIEVQEKERRRIAKDLHDDVGAMLSTIKLGLNQIGWKVRNLEGVKEGVKETKGLLDDTIQTIRRISKALLPATLEEFGLEEALKELCEKMDGASEEIDVMFHNEGEITRLEIPKELALFRVTQEALNNALKHAEATLLEVVLEIRGEDLDLLIEDDGKGFDMVQMNAEQGSKKGLGLRNMESRVSLYGGKVTFDSAPGKGTRIKINMPR